MNSQTAAELSPSEADLHVVQASSIPILPSFWRYSIYPVVFFGGTLSAFVLASYGIASPVVYFSVMIPAGLFLIGMEYYYPRQAEWKADKSDYKYDFFFLFQSQVINVILTPLKMLLAAFFFKTLLQEWEGIPQIWPHHWPLSMQVLLSLLSFTFFRYWYHRAMHQPGKLWKTHALHHSPRKFSWLKSIAGHPLDAIPMDLLGTLPLIGLGVSPLVLTLMAIIVGLTGMLAHTSLDLRTGLLCYLFNTTEVHEVHHAADILGEGNNFGDVWTLWDHLFGSFRLDSELIGKREIGFSAWPEHLPERPSIKDFMELPFKRS